MCQGFAGWIYLSDFDTTTMNQYSDYFRRSTLFCLKNIKKGMKNISLLEPPTSEIAGGSKRLEVSFLSFGALAAL